MSRDLCTPMALAARLAREAHLTETTTGDGQVWKLYPCPARLSDGSPCQKQTTTRDALEQHLLQRHNLNSRKGHNWRDAHDVAARMQGCAFLRTWPDEEMGTLDDWPGVIVEARVGHFLYGRESYVTRAGFACERVVWRSQNRTYCMVDAGLYAILLSAFEATPTRAEAIKIGHMILNEAWRQYQNGGGA